MYAVKPGSKVVNELKPVKTSIGSEEAPISPPAVKAIAPGVVKFIVEPFASRITPVVEVKDSASSDVIIPTVKLPAELVTAISFVPTTPLSEVMVPRTVLPRVSLIVILPLLALTVV